MFHRHVAAVLGPDDCERLVARGRAIGFEPAAVNHYGVQKAMPQVRNNERVEFDDAPLAARLDVRLRAAMGDDFPSTFEGRRYVRLGARFRLYRYVPGQYFKAHKDGAFQGDDAASAVTVLFYLNDTDGGETVLMPDGKAQASTHLAFAPRRGDALLFEHGTWHEGRPVLSGEKLVARTDAFYAKA